MLNLLAMAARRRHLAASKSRLNVSNKRVGVGGSPITPLPKRGNEKLPKEEEERLT